MKCRRVEQLLSEELEELIPRREVQALDDHLRGCPVCHRLRDEIREVRSELRVLAHRLPLRESAADSRAIERWIEERPTLPGSLRWRRVPSAGSPGGPWRAQPLVRASSVRLLLLACASTTLLTSILALWWWSPARDPGPPESTLTKKPSPTRVSPVPHAPGKGQEDRITKLPPAPFGERNGKHLPLGSAQVRGKRKRDRGSSNARATSKYLAISGPHQGHNLGDLDYINRTPKSRDQLWVTLTGDEWERIETRVRQTVRVRDDFVQIPFIRLASTSVRQVAQAVESYKREAAIVDPRLAREVTLAFKATALSDLCDHLHANTGTLLVAGRSVADEKVTIFCEKMPLREVMRQLSRPFGYTWLRSRRDGEYRYELVQDLRSQLVEEELRNRDRNAALLALDREMSRFRSYLSLSPDEALARTRTAAHGDKELLERYATYGWGPAQMYFRLSPNEQAALRAGQTLSFSSDPKPGEQLLPADVARGVLQSQRDTRVRIQDGRFMVGEAKKVPDGLAPASVPEAQALVTLRLDPSELGQFMIVGGSGIRLISPRQSTSPNTTTDLAVGISPTTRDPGNEAANAGLATDPLLRRTVSVQPLSSCRRPERAAGPRRTGAAAPVTSADVLEALHQATGLPMVADYYTRLYHQRSVSVEKRPLFEALNRLADVMRLRWHKDFSGSGGTWLQFRSASFYDDRRKEVPNRLLFRWAASRREQGVLPLDRVLEIAQLSDVQLDSTTMAEGAKECFGLAEWVLVRRGEFRSHLRWLAELTPSQRRAAMSAGGLEFTQMSLSQQQQFIARLGLGLHTLTELVNANLRLEYTQPGAFEWKAPESLTVSLVREQSREAALTAAQRINPQASASQIVPTELALTVLYTWGSPQVGGGSLAMRATPDYTSARTDRFPDR
jgi:hypothetical protein